MTAEHTEAAIFALQDLLSVINTDVPQDSASSSLFSRLLRQKIEHSSIGTIAKRITSRSDRRMSKALAGILHLNRMLAQSLIETLQALDQTGRAILWECLLTPSDTEIAFLDVKKDSISILGSKLCELERKMKQLIELQEAAIHDVIRTSECAAASLSALCDYWTKMQHRMLEIYVDCLNTTVRTDSQLFLKRLEELVNTNLPITLVQASRFAEGVALVPLDVALN